MRQQERTANNLANANTIGYKKGRVFTEVLSEELDNEGSPQSVNRLQQWTDPSQGALKKTGNPLDVALSGKGFFAVRDTNGNTFYTRAGRFSLDQNGVLRDINGYTVQGENGPVTLPTASAEAITITQQGDVKSNEQKIDQLQVVSFEDPRALQHHKGALMTAANEPPAPMDSPSVQQGFVEQSNVEPVHAMTNMIEQARFFETQQRWLSTTDQLLGQATQKLGKF